MENLSALIETLLLFVTCFWIIYEVAHRLISGKTDMEVTIWSYIVVISSIIVDFSRSRALSRVAKKYNSQALEADALHFSTDIWSSSVVLIGLICANFGFFFADSIAALFVAMIVIYVCYTLGKRSIDMLLDRVSTVVQEKVENSIAHVTDITHYQELKIRSSGADTFVEVCIHVKTGLTIDEAHKISHHVDDEIKKNVNRAHVHIHTEPETEMDVTNFITKN